MSQEMDYRSGAMGLGGEVAHFLGAACDVVPTQAEAEQRLATLLQEIQQRDQRSNDTVANYIRTCQDWSSHTRQGMSGFHYYIDTCLEGEDGSMTYIVIDHTFPIVDDEKANDQETEDQKIRRLAMERLPRLVPEEVVNEQDLTDFIVGTANHARVRHFTKEAVESLRNDARDGSPVIELLRLRYKRKPVIALDDYWPDLVHDYPEPSNWSEMLTEEITTAVVALKGQVAGEDVSWLIVLAQQIAAERVAEAETHGDEYYQLYNQIRYDASLSDEQKKAIAQRMQEIVRKHGPPDADFGNWLYVIPRHLDALVKAIATADTLWNEDVFAALIDKLKDNGLYLYEREVRTRIAAARTIANQQLTQTAARIGSQALHVS